MQGIAVSAAGVSTERDVYYEPSFLEGEKDDQAGYRVNWRAKISHKKAPG
jgi:hypothetical protein